MVGSHQAATPLQCEGLGSAEVGGSDGGCPPGSGVAGSSDPMDMDVTSRALLWGNEKFLLGWGEPTVNSCWLALRPRDVDVAERVVP